MTTLSAYQKIHIRSCFVKARAMNHEVRSSELCHDLGITEHEKKRVVMQFKKNLSPGLNRPAWVPCRFQFAMKRGVVNANLVKKMRSFLAKATNSDFLDISGMEYDGVSELLSLARDILGDHLRETARNVEAEQAAEIFNSDTSFFQTAIVNKYESGTESGIAMHSDSDTIFGTVLYIWNETSEGPFKIPRYKSYSTATNRDLILLDPNARHEVVRANRRVTRYSIAIMF